VQCTVKRGRALRGKSVELRGMAMQRDARRDTATHGDTSQGGAKHSAAVRGNHTKNPVA
jgi:hypothetical protein